MKIKLLPVILCELLISACNQSSGSKGPKAVLVDFTIQHEQVDDIPTTGDTGKLETLKNCLNKYYITDPKIQINSIEGEFLQLQNGFNVTQTRKVDQMMMLASRAKDCAVTFTFARKIKTASFVCEAYSKYDTYNNVQNVDHDTYLQVNGERVDITGHTQEDENETRTYRFDIDSSKLQVVVPNNYVKETSVQRVMLYRLMLEY